MKQARKSRLRRLSRVDLWLAYGACAALGAMMVFIFFTAVMRYVFNAPIVGANEALSLVAVAMVMLALPYATTQDSHVRIDLFDSVLGRLGILLTDVVYRLVALVVLWFLSRAYVLRALDAYEFEDTTNMLGVAIWPFYALVAFGIAAFAVILAGQLALMLVRR